MYINIYIDMYIYMYIYIIYRYKRSANGAATAAFLSTHPSLAKFTPAQERVTIGRFTLSL